LWHGLTRLLAVYDGTGNLKMRFEYASSRMPVSVDVSGARYYLCYDQVGSLILVTDISGAIIKQVDYDIFGSILTDGNPAFEIPFGFAGGLLDYHTGLVRFGYRDYDPEVGQWTAKDPIFFDGGDTDLYGYVQNDPVNMIDPCGLWGWAGSGIGAVSGIIGGVTTGFASNGISGAISGGIIGGAVGGIVGFVAPNLSSTAAILTSSTIIGAISNTAGQVIGNWASGNSAFENFSLTQVIASSAAGVLTALHYQRSELQLRLASFLESWERGLLMAEFQVFLKYSQVPWWMQMMLIYLRHRVTKNGFSQG